MKNRDAFKRGVFWAAGVGLVGVVVAVGLSLPRVLRSRAADAVEQRLGLRTAIDEVVIGASRVSLVGMTVSSGDGRAIVVELGRVHVTGGLLSLGLRGAAAIEGVEIEGADVAIDRHSAALRDLMSRLRAGAARGGGGEASTRRTFALTGGKLAVREGAEERLRVGGLSVQMTREGVEGSAESVIVRDARLVGELQQVKLELARREAGFRVESVDVARLEVVTADVEAPGAAAEAHPPDAAHQEHVGVWALLEPWVDAGTVLTVRDAHVVRVVRDGREPILEQVNARVEASEGNQVRIVAHGAAVGGGRLDIDMKVWPRDLRADGSIVLRALPLTLIVPLLPQVPWHEPASSSVDAELSVKAESPARVALSGRAKLSRAAIFSPRIAPTPVKEVTLDLDGTGAWIPLQRRLEVSEGKLSVGAASLFVSGALEITPEHYVIELDARLPPTKCTDAVRAVPADLLAELSIAEWSGTLGGRLRLQVDSRELKKTVLDVEIRDQCEFVSLPAMADLRRFAGPFMHTVVEPDDTLFELETGPGTDAWTPIEAISPFLVHAVLTHEDPGFFSHKGFSLLHVRNALVRNLEEGRYVVGASTITMQLVKNVFLRREKTLARKLQEVLLTWWTERAMQKRDILELYLNVIEYGPGVYGIRNGARHYFNRLPAELSPAEAVFLSTILPSPKRYHSLFERGALTPTWQALMRRQMQRLQQRGAFSQEAVEYGMREIDAFKFVPEGMAAAPRVVPGETAPLPIGAEPPVFGDQDDGETFDEPPADYE